VKLDEAAKAGLGTAVDRVLSGTPVLFLDVRPRKPLSLKTALSRDNLVQWGLSQLSDWYDELLKVGLCETFDACSLAFMHQVLSGDGRSLMASTDVEVVGIPLHKAIELASKGKLDDELQGPDANAPAKATSKQIADVSQWLANRAFGDAWQIRDDLDRMEAKGKTYHDVYKEQIFAYCTCARTLLASPNMYHANLFDEDASKDLVNQLVRLDRLPTCNVLEGLCLLRSAWRDYDVAMKFAGRYKMICKVIYALQLLLGWIAVGGSVMSAYLVSTKRGNISTSAERVSNDIVEAVFIVSVSISFLVAVEGILTPKARWRQLRSKAGQLQSMIWLYRTRVGPFDVTLDGRRDSTGPEIQLCSRLNDWRDELVAGAALKATDLEREHDPSVYKHFQDRGDPSAGEDDHHSPTQPQRYIELRIEPAIAFYKRRIPQYTRRDLLLKVTLLSIGIASSILARYQELTMVAIATAAATALKSWGEFANAEVKMERYSGSITSLKQLLSWWDCLSDVKKASRDSIGELVLQAESIISQEQLSWTAAASKESASDRRKDEGKDNETGGGSKSGESKPGAAKPSS